VVILKRGILLAGALIGTVILLALALSRLNSAMEPAMNHVVTQRTGPLVLDAGHGGEDGGAVSITGVPESRINLSIVLSLRDVLGLYGVDPILLREEDISLHTGDANTLREKKRSDLKNRTAAIEAVEGGTLLSIHQNTYPGSRYHGTHVFYAPTDGSQALADHVQNSIKTALQPDNERAVKQIPDTVYIMNHITCPAILIECGFLTNPAEEAMLRDPDYQRKLSAVIAAAWLTAEG
jgi:N-acetylmuramoyl-L-alanine amidase